MATRNQSGPKAPPCTSVGPNDVLLGRGNNILRNEGNVRFLALVEDAQPGYRQARRNAEKNAIAIGIFNTIVRRQGKFLRTAEPSDREETEGAHNSWWSSVQDDVALEKVKQALRDYGHKKSRRRSEVSSPEAELAFPSASVAAHAAASSSPSIQRFPRGELYAAMPDNAGMHPLTLLRLQQQADQQRHFHALLQLQVANLGSQNYDSPLDGGQVGSNQALMLQEDMIRSSQVSHSVRHLLLMLQQQPQSQNTGPTSVASRNIAGPILNHSLANLLRQPPADPAPPPIPQLDLLASIRRQSPAEPIASTTSVDANGIARLAQTQQDSDILASLVLQRQLAESTRRNLAMIGMLRGLVRQQETIEALGRSPPADSNGRVPQAAAAAAETGTIHASLVAALQHPAAPTGAAPSSLRASQTYLAALLAAVVPPAAPSSPHPSSMLAVTHSSPLTAAAASLPSTAGANNDSNDDSSTETERAASGKIDF